MSNKKTLSLERLLEIAADEFCQRPYEDVSVAEISKLAHCSTATIYDVFCGKDDLFRQAILARLERSWPEMPEADAGAALPRLLDYFEIRLRQLASEDARKLCSTVISRRSIVGEQFMAALHMHRAAVDEVMTRYVGMAIAEGSMVSDKPASVGYLLSASCAYESALYGLTFGADFPIDVAGVVRKTFEPFVTTKGRAVLKEHLARGSGTITRIASASSSAGNPNRKKSRASAVSLGDVAAGPGN